MQDAIDIEVWGGAGEHGRSSYRVYSGDISILLDCGGKKENGGLYPGIVPQQAMQLNAVFLSHAHEDHMAALPLLLEYGYEGEVWMTKETYRLLPAYARAWLSYVESHDRKLPYRMEDWTKLRYRFLDEAAPEGTWFSVLPGLRVCWGPSGHLPGGVWLLLDIAGKLAFYSGDYSGESALLRATLPDASLMDGKSIELAIVDGAYGDSPASQRHLLTRLTAKITEVHRRGGQVLLPVPLSGRGMDLLVELTSRLPGIPITAEAALICEWSESVLGEEASKWLRHEAVSQLRNALPAVRSVDGDEERKNVLSGKPGIILAPDGMMLAEPARTYGLFMKDDPRHAVLFTGHLSADSLALASKTTLCETAAYRYKVHQGLPDATAMLAELRPKRALLVHAEAEGTHRLIAELQKSGTATSFLR